MREELLFTIEKNSRIDLKELSVILGISEEDVINELQTLENEGIIEERLFHKRARHFKIFLAFTRVAYDDIRRHGELRVKSSHFRNSLQVLFARITPAHFRKNAV